MQNLLRFIDLKNSGMIGSRPTLARMIKNHEFPPGRLLGAKTRVWTEDEVDAWFASRSTKGDAGSENIVVSLDRVRTQLIDVVNIGIGFSPDVLADAEKLILELHKEITAALESSKVSLADQAPTSLCDEEN